MGRDSGNMPVPRFRIKALMIAVTAVGLALGLQQHWARFQARAKYHSDREEFYSAVAFLSTHRDCGTGIDETLTTLVRRPDGSWEVRPVSAEAEKILQERAAARAARAEQYERLAAYHGRLSREYAHSSTRPWIVVRDDGAPAEP